MQQADYHARLEQAVLLLEGKHQSLCQELQEKMEAAAEELRFERAAEYRDRLRAIELLGQKQLVTAGTMADTDVIGWYQTEAKACFAVLHFIKGNLMDKDYEVLPVPEEPDDALSSLVKQYYLTRKAARAAFSSRRRWTTPHCSRSFCCRSSASMCSSARRSAATAAGSWSWREKTPAREAERATSKGRTPERHARAAAGHARSARTAAPPRGL